MIPGNYKGWDLQWLWNLMKLAYHCRKWTPDWTCPPFHLLSYYNTRLSRRKAALVCGDHTPQISVQFLRSKNYWIDALLLILIRYSFLFSNLSQTVVSKKMQLENTDHQYTRYKENTILKISVKTFNRYSKIKYHYL